MTQVNLPYLRGELRRNGVPETTMLRTKNQEHAAEFAGARHQLYGFCVFDGWFYTGTAEQLSKLSITPMENKA